ncbi:GAF domain-containing protein [Phycicoccus sp. DTK01]|uniref:GAF domain-containing protein n=1 Tax=Phycicoccus sp. DTK01 TaxID=2785745 RepID=UPI001A8E94F2|nr:GAF domain-containing protein [Phycicoccus sp. DTK01]GIL36395.1 transcriptional regulator [Phycicoccus sp. DTK01]
MSSRTARRGAGGPDGVRSVVAESWLRSSAAGVDPEGHLPPVVLDGGDLADYRTAHALSHVFPLLYDVLGRAAVDCDALMAVGDASGHLLWVAGARHVLRRAEDINFVEGSAWNEHSAGTNAPGMALHLDGPAVVRAGEHFNRLVHPWSCAAAPIHDPTTSAVLGVVDITGGPDVASPQSLAMIRAAARMAESELGRLALTGTVLGGGEHPGAGLGPGVVRVRGLGLPEAVVEVDGRTHRLSRRHSEIVVALTENPRGLSAEQLETEVYPGRVTSSTLRAEMTRLRTLLGPEVMLSRPYRVQAETETDWSGVLAHLAAGRVRDALRAYKGPLLPGSEAPAVVELREVLEARVRAAVLASGEADLMVGWTRSRWGAGDLEMWERQLDALPAASPLRPVAEAEVARLLRDDA